MSSKIVLGFAIAGLALLAWATKAHGDCCIPSFKNKCADCSGPYVGDYFCAADGSCNVFGCNCDGGCRQGPCRRKRAVEELTNSTESGAADDLVDVDVTGNDVVRWADADADGSLDAREVDVFLARRGIVVKIDAWRSLDADGDGKLTPREIDANLA